MATNPPSDFWRYLYFDQFSKIFWCVRLISERGGSKAPFWRGTRKLKNFFDVLFFFLFDYEPKKFCENVIASHFGRGNFTLSPLGVCTPIPKSFSPEPKYPREQFEKPRYTCRGWFSSVERIVHTKTIINENIFFRRNNLITNILSTFYTFYSIYENNLYNINKIIVNCQLSRTQLALVAMMWVYFTRGLERKYEVPHSKSVITK